MANPIRIAIVMMLFACVASTTATAIVSLGDPWSGNSWGQRFDHQAIGDFEVLRLDWVSGSAFEVPTVFENFGDDAWTASLENPTFACAFGPGLDRLQFDILFSGDIGPTAFTFATYCDGMAQQYFTVAYQESPVADTSFFWSVMQNGNPAPAYPLSSVPDPATFLLLGTGLTVLAGARLRKRLP